MWWFFVQLRKYRNFFYSGGIVYISDSGTQDMSFHICSPTMSFCFFPAFSLLLWWCLLALICLAGLHLLLVLHVFGLVVVCAGVCDGAHRCARDHTSGLVFTHFLVAMVCAIVPPFNFIAYSHLSEI